jgi:hypothetical protein
LVSTVSEPSVNSKFEAFKVVPSSLLLFIVKTGSLRCCFQTLYFTEGILPPRLADYLACFDLPLPFIPAKAGITALDFTPPGGHKDKREIYHKERKR